MTLFDSFRLRPLHVDDALDIFHILKSEQEYLQEWLPFVTETHSIDDTQAFVDYAIDSDDEVFTLRDNDRLIGLIGFKCTDNENSKTEIGYWLCEAYQHKGIMTKAVMLLCQYAFRTLEMNRIQIKCAVGNTKSSNIPKRLGFTLEGIEREGELFADGSYVDLEIYSLLKREIQVTQ